MGNRKVKAFSRSARSEPLPLEERQVAEVRVRVLHGEALLAMIERSRPHITYWPAFKAAGYDRAERLS
jgi:hypothetical protein